MESIKKIGKTVVLPLAVLTLLSACGQRNGQDFGAGNVLRSDTYSRDVISPEYATDSSGNSAPLDVSYVLVESPSGKNVSFVELNANNFKKNSLNLYRESLSPKEAVNLMGRTFNESVRLNNEGIFFNHASDIKNGYPGNVRVLDAVNENQTDESRKMSLDDKIKAAQMIALGRKVGQIVDIEGNFLVEYTPNLQKLAKAESNAKRIPVEETNAYGVAYDRATQRRTQLANALQSSYTQDVGDDVSSHLGRIFGAFPGVREAVASFNAFGTDGSNRSPSDIYGQIVTDIETYYDQTPKDESLEEITGTFTKIINRPVSIRNSFGTNYNQAVNAAINGGYE